MSDRTRIARKRVIEKPLATAQSDTLQRSAATPEQSVDVSTRELMEPRFGHDFSKIRIHAPAKAESSPVANTPISTDQPGDIPYNPAEVESIGPRIQAEAGGGSALDNGIRTQLESGVDADLSRVRIHTDSRADQLAHSVDAVAFTTGTDIFFRAGSYDPSSPQGLHLLAHEATHTIQQSAGPVAGTLAPGGIVLSDPSDSFEQNADQTATKFTRGQVDQADASLAITGVAPQIKDQPTGVSSMAPGLTEAQNAPLGGIATDAVPVQRQTETEQAQAATQQQEPSSDEIWQGIELRATPELLIKFQEIGRTAGEETKDQVDSLFSPYEDSLESDQTFLDVVSLGLSAAGNVPQSAGPAGLAAAGTDATKLIMRHMLDFKSVGEVKKAASKDVGSMVMSSLTSDSANYIDFEAQALRELRQEFDDSWARVPPEQRTLAIAVPLFTQWFQMEARTKYGADSPAGRSVLAAIHEDVANQLKPAKAKLDDLKEKQRGNRVMAGALGGAVTGAIIGGFIGNVPGAIVGGIIGGVAGAVIGAIW